MYRSPLWRENGNRDRLSFFEDPEPAKDPKEDEVEVASGSHVLIWVCTLLRRPAQSINGFWFVFLLPEGLWEGSHGVLGGMSLLWDLMVAFSCRMASASCRVPRSSHWTHSCCKGFPSNKFPDSQGAAWFWRWSEMVEDSDMWWCRFSQSQSCVMYCKSTHVPRKKNHQWL